MGLRTIYAKNRRQRPYTIIQGQTAQIIKARTVTQALSKAVLLPGAVVRVWVAQIVHGRRSRNGI